VKGVFAELGNVLTRVSVRDGRPGDERVLFEEAIPTTVNLPYASPAEGLDLVLEAAAPSMPDTGPRAALYHYLGCPRTAVFGASGLATTELSVQSALRRGGSSVVQVRVSDTAALEGQLIELRGQPSDLLIFTGSGHQAAERLMAGGGPTPRVLPAMAAIYNGPKADFSAFAEVLGSKVDLLQTPPLRSEAGDVDPLPTEEAIANVTARILAADPLLEPARRRGFTAVTFAAALTAGVEALSGLWSERGPRDRGRDRGSGEIAYAHVGGRFLELAVTSRGEVFRLASELSPASPAGPVPDVAAVGAWLPQAVAGAVLSEALANYLRRPFSFPSTWQQVLLLAALARERLLEARGAFRAPAGTGDWRSRIGAYIAGGGYLRHLPGPGMALAVALDGLQPLGVSEVYCDRRDAVPFTGALRRSAPAPAAGFDIEITRLATVVAPVRLVLNWRRPHEDDLLAVVTVKRSDGKETTFRITPGSLVRFPLRPGEPAELAVSPLREHDFGAGPGREWRGRVVGGRLGLVFDARGRPIALPADVEVRESKLREWLNTLDAGAPWGGVP